MQTIKQRIRAYWKAHQMGRVPNARTFWLSIAKAQAVDKRRSKVTAFWIDPNGPLQLGTFEEDMRKYNQFYRHF